MVAEKTEGKNRNELFFPQIFKLSWCLVVERNWGREWKLKIWILFLGQIYCLVTKKMAKRMRNWLLFLLLFLILNMWWTLLFLAKLLSKSHLGLWIQVSAWLLRSKRKFGISILLLLCFLGNYLNFYLSQIFIHCCEKPVWHLSKRKDQEFNLSSLASCVSLNFIWEHCFVKLIRMQIFCTKSYCSCFNFHRCSWHS